MKERIEYAIAVMYKLAGIYKQQVFVINSDSINEGLQLTNFQNNRTNRYIIAGRIAKSEVEFNIPAAKDIEWTGTLLPISPNIFQPSRN